MNTLPHPRAKLVAVASLVAVVLAAQHAAEARDVLGWSRTLEERQFTRDLDARADRIARGEEREWQALRRIWHSSTDGIVSTAYYSSLGETLYRSPAMFLERHLAGDPDAMKMAACGLQILLRRRGGGRARAPL